MQEPLHEDSQTLAAARQRSVALQMRLSHCQEGSDGHPGACPQHWYVAPRRGCREGTGRACAAPRTRHTRRVAATLRFRAALCGAGTTTPITATAAALLGTQKEAGEVCLRPRGGARSRPRAAQAQRK
jgi:hypothetical protein